AWSAIAPAALAVGAAAGSACPARPSAADRAHRPAAPPHHAAERALQPALRRPLHRLCEQLVLLQQPIDLLDGEARARCYAALARAVDQRGIAPLLARHRVD